MKPRNKRNKKFKKPEWLIEVEDKIEKMADEEFDKLFEEIYEKLNRGGLREVLNVHKTDKSKYKKYKKPKWLIEAEKELEKAIETGEYFKWLKEQGEKYRKQKKEIKKNNF
ncbi:hypothetical protein [Methanocaldococcus jannaschii]|nr:hypothetical protein [Methanocaldococcus jannaschii]